MSTFSSVSEFHHDRPASTGILITNLGTPDAPTAAALRRYLGEFLSDPRVVEQPRLLWKLVLHGVILRTRPRKVAKSYAKIWQQDGSPLMSISQQQAQALQQAVETVFQGPVHVALGMRYGQPSIPEALQQLRQAGAQRILVLPLYPQYSATTTASTLDAVSEELRHWRRVPALRFVNHYHDHPAYIEALAASILEARQQHGEPDKLIFSFHGLPQRYFDAGDPYYCECQKTARLLAQQLALEPSQWKLSFQSRFGPEAWLQPYTDHTLADLAKAGQQHVQVICPGFAADCLETLEEIDEQFREVFMQAGGKTFHYIPALNTAAAHIDLLSQLIKENCHDWIDR